MTTVDFEPLTVSVPLREDPPGVFRVGKSRVLLELVLEAHKGGQAPEEIVQSFPTLELADVYAVITRYVASPAPFDEYLRLCDQEAEEIRRRLECMQQSGPTKIDLLERAKAKGLLP